MTGASRQRVRQVPGAGRGAAAPPPPRPRRRGRPEARAGQGRGHLLITGTRPEGIVEVRDDLLPELARLGGRQAAHGPSSRARSRGPAGDRARCRSLMLLLCVAGAMDEGRGFSTPPTVAENQAQLARKAVRSAARPR